MYGIGPRIIQGLKKPPDVCFEKLPRAVACSVGKQNDVFPYDEIPSIYTG
jgi:hypothetical protein